MGQKVNPTGFRIGITEPWRSRWFASKKSLAHYWLKTLRFVSSLKRNISSLVLRE